MTLRALSHHDGRLHSEQETRTLLLQARLAAYAAFLAISCWSTQENLFALLVTSSCSTIVSRAVSLNVTNHPGGCAHSVCTSMAVSKARSVPARAELGGCAPAPAATVRTVCVNFLTPACSQDQIAAFVGFSGTVAPSAVITVICCLLVVNAVFYIFFMHIVYHVLMRCVP